MQGGCRQNESSFFLVLSTDRTKGSRHKLKHRRFYLDIQKFIPVRVTEHWNNFPGRMRNLHLGDIQRPPGHGLGEAALRLDQVTSRVDFQPQPVCDFVEDLFIFSPVLPSAAA